MGAMGKPPLKVMVPLPPIWMGGAEAGRGGAWGWGDCDGRG